MNFIRRCSEFANLTMLHYSLFSLPMTLVGAIMPFAQPEFTYTGGWGQWLWIIMAFICARTAGMCFNRVIDAKIDKLNPRTKHRSIPQGKISTLTVWVYAFTFLFIFIYSCVMINRIVLMMSFIATFLIILYPLCKRFTTYRHFILAAVQFFAPVCGWAAITGEISLTAILLGLSVFCWMGAKDIIYSLQDEKFQKRHGLYGIPVKFGAKKSILIAKIIHFIMLFFLIQAGLQLGLGMWYYIGLASCGFLISILYQRVDKCSLKKIASSFFWVDVGISCTIFTSTSIAVLSALRMH